MSNNPIIEVEIKGNLNNFKQIGNEAKVFARDTKKEIDKTLLMNLELNVANFQLKLEESRKLLRQAKKEGDQEGIIKLQVDTNALQRGLTEGKRQLNNFVNTGETGISRLQAKFNGIGDKITALGGPFGSIGNNIKGLGSTAENVFGGMKNQISQLGSVIVGAFAVNSIVNFFGDATKAAFEFQKSLIQIKTVLSGTNDEFATLGDTIKKISTETGLSAIKLADAAFYVASAGVQLKDLPQVLDTIAKASVATGSDATVIFNGLSSVASIYGVELSNLTQISDAFFKANAEGKLTIEGLSAAIGTVAPIAKTAGVSLNELLSGFATLVGVTGNADEVATQLKGAIQAIVAPGAEAADTAKKYGIELGQTAIKSKGFAGVLKDIYDKTGGNLAIIKDIIPEVRALTAVTQLGGEGNKLYSDNLDGLKNSLGETSKAFDIYSNSEVGTLEKSKQEWENWKISIGNKFVSFAATLIKFGKFFTNWGDLLGRVIGEVALFLGTGFTFLGELIGNFIGFFVVNWTNLGKNIAKITENLIFNMGQAFNGLKGLIARALSKALKPVTEFLNGALDKYNEFAKSVGQEGLVIKTKIAFGKISGASDVKAKFKDIMEGTQKINTDFSFGITSKMIKATINGLSDIKNRFGELTGQVKELNVATKQQNEITGDTLKTNAKQIVTLDSLNQKLSDLKAKLGTTEVGTKAFTDLQKQIKYTEKLIDSFDPEKKSKAGKSAETAAKQEAKKQLDIKQKLLEDEAKLNIKIVNDSTLNEEQKAIAILAINKKLSQDILLLKGEDLQVSKNNAEEIIKIAKEQEDARKKSVTSFYDEIDKKIKTSEGNIQDYQKEVNKVNEEFKKLRDDATKNIRSINEELATLGTDTQVKIAERELQALQEQKDVQQQINDLKAKGINISMAQSIGLDSLKQIQNAGGTEIGGSPIEDMIKIVELLKQQKALQDEITLAKEKTTEEIFNEVKRVSELSDTQKIIEDQQKSTAILEERKKINQAILDGETINLSEIKDLKNRDMAEELIARQTQVTQDLAIAQAGLTAEKDALIKLVKDKRKIELDYSTFFKGEIDNRIADIKRLATELKAANADIATLQSGQVVNNTSNTTNIGGVTNNTDVDLESFFRKLNP
ncbi:MAG: phage tail tape measure protein [Candidatus Gracilibacteria bacterium]|nr:phage tail tape measure protein [Candidatus Gracilibacteria bacterium]